MELEPSRSTATPSDTIKLPPLTMASSSASLTKKLNSAVDETKGFPPCLPVNLRVYDTPAGSDRAGRYSCGVSDLVTFGSSVTSVPSDRDADQPKVYPASLEHAAFMS